MFRGNTNQRQPPRDQSRGRGQSRGAPNSSSGKSFNQNSQSDSMAVSSGTQPLHDSSNTYGTYKGKNFDPEYHLKRKSPSLKKHNSSRITDAGSHSFEQERRENAAKRELRGNTANRGDAPRGRGGRGESSLGNRAGFTKPSSQHHDSGRSSKESSPAPSSSFLKPTSRTTSPAPTTMNPFVTTSNPSASNNPFGASNGTTTMSNPFGLPAQPANTGVFGMPSSNPTPSVFGAASSNSTTSVFGMPSSNTTTSVFGTPSHSQPSVFNPFGTSDGVKPSSTNPFGSNSGTSATGSTTQSTFGAAAKETSSIAKPSALPMSKKFGPQGLDPFASNSPKPTPAFGVASKPLLSSNSSNNGATFGASSSFKPSPSTTLNAFGKPSPTPMSATSISNKPAVFGASNSTSTSSKTIGSLYTPTSNGAVPKANGQLKAKEMALQKVSKSSGSAWAEWTQKLADHLKQEGIVRPTYPGNAGNPTESAKIDVFFRGPLRKYREKVRKSFMKANLMDDPDKPKKLSDAIDFKGTCEDMCPFKECFERIMEGPSGVSFLEKERSPTGELWPSLEKMVKKHSRSAAGDEEPLPEDIRSPPTLRRTVDYLMNTILSSDEELPKVHGFLWDRTRAIRRDFIFQQAAMSNGQMEDLVYCLEHIIRFHILALHQMSKRGIAASEYNEQQELEQLQKAMISLMHAYGDCSIQGTQCQNEAEFRAYNLVLFAETPRVYDGLEEAKSRLGQDSKEIKAGVAILECLRTCWEKKGPLEAFRPTEMANNPFQKFFSEVAGNQTWYLLACFAEIHFNSVRKAALKHALKAFRQDGAQTMDFTLKNLQNSLSFDNLEDIVTFGEKHSLKFEDLNGEKCLSIKSSRVILAPHPRPRQIHSSKNVEVKRGPLSLSEIIDGNIRRGERKTTENSKTVEKTSRLEMDEDEDFDIDLTAPADEMEEDSLFVEDNTISTIPQTQVNPTLQSATQKKVEPRPAFTFGSQPSTQNFGKPAASVFDQVKPVQSFGNGFFTQGLAGNSSAAPPASTKPIPQAPSVSLAPSPQPSSPFSQPPPAKTAEVSAKPPPTLGNYTITRTPAVDPTSISFGGYPVSRSSSPAVGITDTSTLPKSSTIQQQALPSPFFGAQPAFPAPVVKTAPTTSFAPQAPPPQPVINHMAAPAPSAPTFTAPNSSLSSFGQTTSSTTPSQTPFPAINALQPPTANSSSGVPSQLSVPAVPQVSAESKREALVANTSTWFAIGTDGVLPQFTEYMVEGLLGRVFNDFKAEEAAQVARQELEAANRLADEHRRQVVGVKFIARWRHIAHIRWVRRQAVAARQLRKEMFEASRAKKAAASASLVEDFKSSTQSKRGKEQSLGNALAATGVLNGVHDRSVSIRNILGSPKGRQRTGRQSEYTQPSNHSQGQRSVNGSTSVHKKSKSQAVEPSLSSSRHGKSSTGNPLRQSLNNSSRLNGESRIFRKETWSDEDEMRERPSGTQTDYFRLKARGIHTMYDGTPLASSVASLKGRQSRDADARSDSRRHSTNSYGRSMSSRHFGDSQASIDIGDLKANARSFVEHDRTSRKRRSVDDDKEEDTDLISRVKRLKEQMADDREDFRKSQSMEADGVVPEKRPAMTLNFTEEEIEILARSKRVKEQMDEGVLWYQEQVEKESQRAESRGRS